MGNVIVESNRVLKFMRPDLYVTVLDPGTEDFKKSAQEFLDRAGAAILHERSNGGAAWQGVSLKPVVGRPVFRISPPPYVTEEIVGFVRGVVAGESRFLTELSARVGWTRVSSLGTVFLHPQNLCYSCGCDKFTIVPGCC